jgi:hypothetical protein
MVDGRQQAVGGWLGGRAQGSRLDFSEEVGVANGVSFQWRERYPGES